MSQNSGLWADRVASVGLAASGLLLVLLGMMPAGLAVPNPAGLDVRLDVADLQAVNSNPATLIRIDGARDLLPLNRALKQRLEAESPDLAVEVQATGTETGLAALKRGEVDLVALERSLTPDELAQDFKTLWLDRAQIAVIVGEDNPFKGYLTVRQFEQILRGDITNWTQVGGPDRPIRVIDRPVASETRAVLQQYGLVPPDALPAAVNRVLLKTDDTAEVISKLGKDGIGYAIASQLTQQTKARMVKLAVPQEVLPADARYPLEQVGAIAYRPGSRVATVVQNLAASPAGQALLTEARQAIALEAGRPKTVAIAPGEVVPGGRGIGSLLKWVLLPLLVLGGLLKLVQAVLARQARQRNRALADVERAVPLGRSPDSGTTRPAATAAKVITNGAQTRIPADTAWASVRDAAVIEDELESESSNSEPESVIKREDEPLPELSPDRSATDAEVIAEEIDEPEDEREEELELAPEVIIESNPEAPLESALLMESDRASLAPEEEPVDERENEPSDELISEDAQNALVTGLAFSQALIGEPRQVPSLVETLRSEKQALEREIEALRSRLQDADTMRTQLEMELETARAGQSARTAELDKLRQTLAGITQEKESYWQALSGFYAAFVGEALNPGEPIDFAQLRPQIEHRQSDLAALHDQLEESQREREALAADLEAASAELHQVNAERNELTNQIVSLQQALEAQRNSDAVAEEEAQTLRTLLHSTQVEKGDLEAQLDDLRSQLELTQREKNDTDQELMSLRSRLTELEALLEALEAESRTELERVRSQAANAEAAISETETTLSALRLELDHERATRSELDAEVALLRASVAEATRGRAEEAAARAELVSQNDALAAERDALGAELITLRTQLSDATVAGESSRQEVMELQTQLEAIAAEREAVALQLATLQTRLDEIVQERDALTANLAALHMQLEDKTAAQDRLESELATLRTQLSAVTEERSGLVAQIDELRTQLDEITEQRADSETELVALRSQVQNLTAERNAFETEIARLWVQLEEATQEGDRRQSELSTLHTQINEITLEKDRFEAEVATLRARLSELDDERNTFEADLTALQVQLDEFESGREALESEVNALRTQLQEAQDNAKGTKAALESALGTVREQLVQVTDERNAFEAELASVQKQQEDRVQEREQERLALQEQMSTLQVELATMNGDRAALEAERVALRTQLEEAEAEWRSRVQTLETECETLRQAQAETQAQREALQAERDTLRTQLAEVRLQLESLPLALTAEASAVGMNAVEAATGAIAPSGSDQSSIETEPQAREIIQATEPILDTHRDPLRDINGIGPIYEQKLFNAGINTFAALAALTPAQVRAIIRPAAWQQISPDAWIQEAARFAQGVDVPADTHHDPLRDINGIGPVYEQKLFDGGIFTFADLAAATPEQLRTLIQPQSWQRFDPEAWIAEAQVISGRSPNSIPAEVRRDPLLDINGIGPVYEQKLFDAGIYTFADLAAATPEQLRTILQPAAWQRFTPDAWIAEAAVLAARSPELYPDRDPLYEINGIGPVYEQKLFAAGITTFAALAETSEARILEIIQPASWQRIFPDLWIAEAQMRSRQSVQAQPIQPASTASAEPPAAETPRQVESPVASPTAEPPSSPPASKSTPSRKKPPGKRGKRR